jgi:glycosyltransferase involved in cell wall biosynthesis
MLSGSENPPYTSFILPTLNAEALPDNCLASIVRQNYLREKVVAVSSK